MTRRETPFTRPVGATRSAPAQDRQRAAESSPRPTSKASPARPQAQPHAELDRDLDLASGPVTQTTSEALFAGAVEIQIDHHGTIYRLKHTALGKLILTK